MRFFTKLFLGIYGLTLINTIAKLPFSIISIIILTLGIICAVIAHRSKYALLATTFLVIHMTLELPHFIEHSSHTHSGEILGHGLHVIFDVILLRTLSNAWKQFFIYLGIIIIIGISINHSIEVPNITQPFIFGGILGCIATHLLVKNTKQPQQNTSY